MDAHKPVGSLRINSVMVANWRNFVRGEIDLQRRVFIVGPNASGKSNFLDIFRFLQNVASIEEGGFQNSVKRRGGVSSLRSLAARRYSDIIIKITVGTDKLKSLWEYELHFNQDNLRKPIIKKEIVRKKCKEILIRPDQSDLNDPARLTQTALEQVNVNRDFRELADFFATIRYRHIVPQLIREPDRPVGRIQDPHGGDFLEIVAKTTEKTRKSRLRRVKESLSVAVPQLQEIEFFRDVKGTPHLKGKYSNWRARGAWQTEEQFSDGTLRLLGLLWTIIDGNGPLLLEEPELSLHPEVIKYLPQMFSRVQRKLDRQIILSTHSKDLLMDEGIGMDEIAILQPTDEGTTIKLLGDIKDVAMLRYEVGMDLADISIEKTKPERAEQLTFFGDL